MKSTPIEPAELAFDADGTPLDARYGDVYHPRAGALQQARHVFLGGNGLPQRWRGRTRFVVLETGFGLGHDFIATWQAWRDDPQRCARLVFVSIEKHPQRAEALRHVHAGSSNEGFAGQLAEAWPPPLHGLHERRFEGGAVRLLLAFGDVQDWLPELVLQADAVYLDGFAPERNPAMWQPRVFKAIGRLAAAGATVATWSAARLVRNGLAAAGFAVERAPGTGGKRDITLARYAPRFVPRRAPSRLAVNVPAAGPAGTPPVLIVGAGLAGCALAAALADEGRSCVLFERHAGPAAEASGNAGGLFHPIVTPDDGTHARWFRAAAACAAQEVTRAIGQHGVAGAVDGLLRLAAADQLGAMRATLDRLGLPAQHVQALGPNDASERAGLSLAQAAWWFPDGGWVDPAGLASAWLAHAGPAVTRRFGTAVAAIRRHDTMWQLLDDTGTVLAAAPQLVLANAGDALRLLGAPGWPVAPRRGQLSLWRDAPLAPRVPLSGHGYALTLPDGRLLFGAASQPGDADPSVRAADHADNLARLQGLVGHPLAVEVSALAGRTAFRWASDDRLPVIGAVPVDAAALEAASSRLDQPRFVPRREGLYVLTALGSRGISGAALGARVLAALMTGAPCPVEASLLDAIDPARFVSRGVRRGPSG